MDLDDVTMLRVRHTNAFPAAVALGVPFPLEVRLTNESGSTMYLSAPLQLVLEAVNAENCGLERGILVAVASSGERKAKSAAAPCKVGNMTTTDTLGRCDVMITLSSNPKRPHDVATTPKLRLRISVVSTTPVFVSPIRDNDMWPTVLLPEGMRASSVVPQPVKAVTGGDQSATTGDKKADKKRRAAAFASTSYYAYDDEEAGPAAGSDVGNKLMAEAVAGCDATASAVGRIDVIPVVTVAFCISPDVIPVPDATKADGQLQMIPVCGHRISIQEQPMLVGPGFGSVVWDCAVVMSEYLCRNADVLGLRDALVCELGTGTGFVGIALATCGTRVIATDLECMLPIAQHNAALNAKLISDSRGSLDVVAHAWGDALSAALLQSFKYIIASEVVFATELFEPLLASLRALLTPLSPSTPVPTLILAARKRAGCDFADFLTLLAGEFTVTPMPLFITSGVVSAELTAFSRGCTGLSKTKYAPMIFHVTRNPTK